MGEILGLGLSHYPGVAVPPEFQRNMLRGYVNNGRIPAEDYENQAGWPAPMRAEWGDDEGQAAARAHHARLVAGYRALRARLDAFAAGPGADLGRRPVRELQEGLHAAVLRLHPRRSSSAQPLAGAASAARFGTPQNVWGLPPDTRAARARPPRGGQRAHARAARRRISTSPTPTRRATSGAWPTRSRTRSCTWTTTGRASTIPSCRST